MVLAMVLAARTKARKGKEALRMALGRTGKAEERLSLPPGCYHLATVLWG